MTGVENSRVQFFEPDHASEMQRMLAEMYLQSGCPFPLEDFTVALLDRLARAPDPDLAITNLLRFAEASLNKATLFANLVRYPLWLDLLVKIFGTSRYFADILIRDPELYSWLAATDVLDSLPDRGALVSEVQRIEGMFQKPDRVMNSLRRLYRREVLHIGAMDILGRSDLRGVTAALSMVAGVLTDATCRVAKRQLEGRYPHPPPSRFAVIGLGKLGGEELNYSSDIDVIFVYEMEGEVDTSEGGMNSYLEYFNKLCERIVQNLTETSGEGHLYRVDTRLRPESGAGPLARSLESYLLYYESRGELWERQMLIKARPIAGDMEFGEEFIRQLEPFVYPKTFLSNPVESIRRIKARIERSIRDEDNIKLQAGGIRDIEFTVQSLQLLNGGKNPGVRMPNTLRALEALRSALLLSVEEHDVLRDAYVFLRTAEHRLQCQLNTQTHEFPGDEKTRTWLARSMDLENAAEIAARRAQHLQNVRAVFETVLAVPTSQESAGLELLMQDNVDRSVAEAFLRRHGLRDPAAAVPYLLALLSGSTMEGVRNFDSSSREAFREIAFVLFADIQATPLPDITLQNLATVVTSHRFPDQMFRQLEDDGYRHLLLKIASVSPRLIRSLSREPLMFERLPLELEEPVGLDPRVNDGDLVRAKRVAETRLGMKFLAGGISFDELTLGLTHIADEVVDRILREELVHLSSASSPLAVMALGKLGTGEITFDSDLDVLFVGEEGDRRGILDGLASAIVHRAGEFSEQGRLYEVDARLRPEGKSAPLVTTLDGYEQYLFSRASLWERLSVTRLRFCCGDSAVGDRVRSIVDRWAFESPLPAGWCSDMVGMRRKIETRSRVRSDDFFDIKLGPGGMVDVEFAAQMIQLVRGRENATWRFMPTLQVLNRCGPEQLGDDEKVKLIAAYRYLRHLELHMQLTLEDSGSVLPDGEKGEILARCTGEADSGSMMSRVSSHMHEVRSAFLSVTSRLEHQSMS